jgi:hypothetical protein
MNASVRPTLMLKLVDLGVLLLAAYEIQYVRMIHPQYAHVCAAPRAALLDGHVAELNTS